MRKPLAWVFLVAVLAAGSPLHASPVFPAAADFTASVVSGRTNPETYDFAGHGYWKLAQPERIAWLASVQQSLFAGPPGVPECAPESQRRFAGAVWTVVLTQAADAADWQINTEALREKLAVLDARLADAAAAAPSGDARTRELLARFARDQRVRLVFTEREWTQGLPPIAANNWMPVFITRMAAIDCDNTAWLQAQIARAGWFDIPAYGADADSAAWHLVQHADRMPEFQREMLARLQALPPGHTDAKRVAYLHDRVALARKQPQRYGTQGQCQPDGTWTPFDSEDPAGLDERRVALGMKPIAEHASGMSRDACPK